LKIKKILVSQPQPTEQEKSPFFELAEKNNVKIDFRPFSFVEGISVKEFRQSRVDILQHTAVIFTSKTAIDHFFRICEEMRITVPDTMKYFCMSESIAFYLQKYIVYRKRKIFYGKGTFPELIDVIQKHKEEKFLVPLSEQHKPEIPKLLDKNKLKYTKVFFYRNVSSDLSDLAGVNYDIMVFYSPSCIKSLLSNFPDFQQNEIKIASFGNSTAKAVKDAGLRLDIQAPMPQAPSMTMALELYIKEFNKNEAKNSKEAKV
jgi:uroporphyrinogen-III synthase